MKSERKDGFGFGGRYITVMTMGLGESSLKEICSNDSAEGVEMGLILK